MYLNVGLFGFGRTGTLVAQELVKDSAFNLKWVLKKTVNPNSLYASHSLGYDDRFVPFVSAISNYSTDELELIKAARQKTAILASPNITLGINWLLIASKLLKQIIPNADIEIVEEHFRNKKEVSGTALKLAQHLNLDKNNHVNSIRVGGIVGKHEVIFGLPCQTLRLTNESVSRSAFGTGAIFAAKWLMGKESGSYKIENAIHEKFLTHIKDLSI